MIDCEQATYSRPAFECNPFPEGEFSRDTLHYNTPPEAPAIGLALTKSICSVSRPDNRMRSHGWLGRFANSLSHQFFSHTASRIKTNAHICPLLFKTIDRPTVPSLRSTAMFSTQFVVLSFLVLVAPRKTRAFVVTVDVTPHGKPLWTRASDAPLISSDLQHDTCDEYHHESLVYLRQHYRNLWQHQLTADEAYEHAADLVDIALQLTAAARLERESQAAAAHDAMQRAVRECQRVGVLREQAQRETAWAVQDAAGPDALQEALLAPRRVAVATGRRTASGCPANRGSSQGFALDACAKRRNPAGPTTRRS